MFKTIIFDRQSNATISVLVLNTNMKRTNYVNTLILTIKFENFTSKKIARNKNEIKVNSDTGLLYSFVRDTL